MEVITCFCNMSGQKVSLKKSRIFVCNNTPIQRERLIHQISRIQVTKDLGRYLGAPIIHIRASKETYQFTIDTAATFNWLEVEMPKDGRARDVSSVCYYRPP